MKRYPHLHNVDILVSIGPTGYTGLNGVIGAKKHEESVQ